MQGSTLFLIAVFILRLTSLALAVAAEHRRSKATLHTDLSGSHCIYTRDIATWYGLGSLLLVLGSQLVVMVRSRCLCCGAVLRAGGSRACALLLFLASWATFLVAEACLLAASATNAYHTKYRHYLTTADHSCHSLRKGVFQAAATFIVFNAIVSELYYVTYSKAAAPYVFEPPSYRRDSGVRMGSF